MTTTESSQQEKINLLDLDAEGIRVWCASIGQKPFRATQLARWIHRYCCDDFDAMTLPPRVRPFIPGRYAPPAHVFPQALAHQNQ